MNTYEAQCLQLDKELAELLGWHNIRPAQFDTSLLVGRDDTGDKGYIPRWTQDDAEAFRLMVEYDVTPIIGSNQIVARYLTTLVNIADFPDVLSAVRFAIVQATINKLKGN